MTAAGVRPRLKVVWLLLLGLVGAIVVVERSRLFESEPPPKTGTVPMFSFTEAELGAVEVIYQGRFAAAMRNAQGQWFVHDDSHRHSGAPTDASANADGQHAIDPAQATKVGEQIGVTARMIADRLVRPDRDLGAYGLANPQTMIAFYGRNPEGADYSKPLDMLYVGDLLPAEFTYYARKNNQPDMVLIPRYQVALLLSLLFGADQAPSITPPAPAAPAATDN